MRSRELSSLVLATSDRPCDDALAEYAASRLGLPVFRGDVDNVAGRTLACAENEGADWFVRINGDSPFLDANLMDEGIRLAIEAGADLVSNVVDRSYPYGIAVEVFRTITYRRVIPEFDAMEREHIARHFYQHPERFRIVSLPPSADPSLVGVRLTVDDQVDLENVSELLAALGDEADSAGYERVAELARALRG